MYWYSLHYLHPVVSCQVLKLPFSIATSYLNTNKKILKCTLRKNEAINNDTTRVIPKYKHVGARQALYMRFDLGVGVANEGYNEYDSEFHQYIMNLKADEISIVHRESIKPTK